MPRLLRKTLAPLALIATLLVFAMDVQVSAMSALPMIGQAMNAMTGGLRARKGFVAGQGLVTRNGCPIWVEFDEEGGIVREIGDCDLKAATLMAAETYRHYQERYNAITSEYANYANKPVVVKRVDAFYKDLKNSEIKLSPNTYTVLVKDWLLSEGENPILLEAPLNLENLEGLFGGDRVLLLGEEKEILARSSVNIGYLTAFYTPSSGELSFDEKNGKTLGLDYLAGYKPDEHRLWGAFDGVPVNTTMAQYGTITGENGFYVLKYWVPPCPCPMCQMGYTNTIWTELRYHNFNPKSDRGFGLYFAGLTTSEYCLGGNMPHLNFNIAIDMAMLTGMARVKNPGGGEIPIVEANDTTYSYHSTEFVEPDPDGTDKNKLTPVAAYDAFDFNADGVADIAEVKRYEHPDDNKKIVKQEVQVWFSSKTDAEGVLREPDLTRLVDYIPDFKNQGLLKKIGKEDLESTDIFVYRLSNNQLVCSRRGIKKIGGENGGYQDGGVDLAGQKLYFRTPMRGPANNNQLSAGRYFFDNNYSHWKEAQYAYDMADDALTRVKADHLRVGEPVKVILINRATGYMGSGTATVGAGIGDALTGENIDSLGESSTTNLLSFSCEPIVMGPPNIRVRAERSWKSEGVETQDKKSLVGFEGSGLTSDKHIKVTVEWLDQDGSPLPDDLPGYTGRLAKVVAEGQLQAVGDEAGRVGEGIQGNIAQFEIKPGLHTEILQIPNAARPDLDAAHYYIHISGAPISENPDFSTTGIIEDDNDKVNLTGRPLKYVPFQVPVYDEAVSLEAQRYRNELLKGDSEEAEGLSKYVEPIHRWVYRPEMQFSLLEGKFTSTGAKQEVEKESGEDSTPIYLESSGSWRNILYSLLSDDLPALEKIDPDKPLVFSIGGQEIEAVVEKQVPTDSNNSESSEKTFYSLVFPSGMDLSKLLTAEDFLTLRLYMNGDDSNVLWEYKSVFIGIYDTDPQATKCRIIAGQDLTLKAVVRPASKSGKDETTTETPIRWSVVKAKTDRGVKVRGRVIGKGFQIKAEDDSARGWVVVRAETPGYQVKTPDGKYETPFTEVAIRVGCPACTDCDKPGAGFVALSSVDARISLGLADHGIPAGDLIIKSSDITPGLLTPESISVSTLIPEVRQLRDLHGVLRQVETPQAVVDILAMDSESGKAPGYTINFYRMADATWHAGESLYRFTGNPTATWEVKEGGADNKLSVVQTQGGKETPYEYTQDKGQNKETWTFSEAGGERVTEKVTQTLDNGDLSITTTVKDKQNKVASKIRKTWSYAGDILNLQSVTNDPDGADLTQNRTYYTKEETGSDNIAGKLKTRIEPDGSWSRYDYDEEGRTIGETASFLDAAPQASEASVSRTTYNYNPVSSSDSDLEKDRIKPREVRELTQGVLTSRTLYAYAEDDEGTRTEITERCPGESTLFGDASHLRTERVIYPKEANEPWSGKVKETRQPDGRMARYLYEETDDGGIKTTVTHGFVENPSGIAGKTTRDVTFEDYLGRTVRTESHIYTGTDYQLISWSENELDADGHVVKTTTSSGAITEANWGCCNRDDSTDATGIKTDYLYDSLDRLQTSTRKGLKGDIVTTYTYDARGRRVSQTTTAGGITQTTENHYDAAGRLDYSIAADGLKTSYSYSADGLTTTVTRPGGATEISTRFKDGRIKSVTGTAAPSRYYAYGVDDDGQWTKVSHGSEDAPMWETSWSDTLGRTIKTEKPGFGDTLITTLQHFDDKGRIIRTETTGMADTLYVYNEAGEAYRTGLDIDDNGELTLASLDRITESDSLMVKEDNIWWQKQSQIVYADENSDAATTASTSKNRVTGLSSALSSESISMDIHGNKTISRTAIDRATATVTQTVDTPFSDTDQVSVSKYGLVVSSTSTSGLTTTFGYDAMGRRETVTDPRTGTSTTHYNAKGRVDWVEDAAGNRQHFAYDPATGQKTLETNALDKTIRTAYNLRGQVTHTWGDATYPVKYTYDDQGRMKTMTTYRVDALWSGETFPSSATGDVTTWHYDPVTGLLTAKEDAKGKSTDYTYTPEGKLHQRTWARTENGNALVTTYGYDAATGELTGIDYSDETTDIVFAYDRLGRQKQITDAMGNRTFAYNEFLALQSETTTGLISKTLTRTYDTKGRASGFNLGAGYEVAYGFDSKGRFNTLTWNASGHTDTATYNRVGNSEIIGGYTTGSGFATSYNFEPHRNLKTSVENTWDVSIVSNYTYAYDEIGRRSSVKNSGAAFAGPAFTTWGYNDRNEVTESKRYEGDDIADISTPVDPETRLFAYDPIGNRNLANEGGGPDVQKSYVTNELNQYDAITRNGVEEELTYDEDGNMSRYNGNTLEWNGENRLIAYYPTTPDEGSKKYTFTYDYMGRRVKKESFAYASGVWTPEGEVRFVYDGWNLIAELDGAGDTEKSYIWGLDLSQSLQGAGGVGGLVAEVMDGDLFYLAYDANGNVEQVVSGDGEIAAKYEYDAFGQEILNEGVEGGENRFRFSTKYADETGLVYYGYRYYVAEMGRWGSRDPIGERGGVNNYAFVENQGICTFDNLGLWVVKREGEPLGVAEGDCGDTVQELSEIIGLDVDDYRKWLSISPVGGEGLPESFDSPLIEKKEFRIPNTVVSYWAGDADGFGRWYVMWKKNVEYLSQRGFFVQNIFHKDGSDMALQRMLIGRATGKSLHGLYFWGHGFAPYPSVGLTNSNGDNILYYSDYKFSSGFVYRRGIDMAYKMALGLIFACGSNDGKESLYSSAKGGIWYGSDGTLVPHPFRFYNVRHWLKPGAQGTKR